MVEDSGSGFYYESCLFSHMNPIPRGTTASSNVASSSLFVSFYSAFKLGLNKDNLFFFASVEQSDLGVSAIVNRYSLLLYMIPDPFYA